MKESFLYRLSLYLLCFFLSFYSLNAFDYHRFLKKNVDVFAARVLYFLLAACLAYLSAQFFMGIMFFFDYVGK